ncbi:Hypothetical predicted protein [Paramuricea clavata]|uniref:Uncharacterized protein n=1 Tax=Paramuricea clavata TaxID=317549 RepID=A0A7D9L1S3_PARCT|nr:Hypothetical predicted protein [Paramuricea clavata]
MKVLFQELCQSKLGWDEPLSELLYHKWQSWCDELNKVGYIEIPRCYLSNSADGSISYQLHGFCDSSCVCYAAVVYLRVETEVDIRTSLVMSKTRVAPLSQTSIPRLELLSALILARLMAKVMSALQSVIDIDIIKCWTDSITALFWIQGKEKEWKTFVENRVNEIRSLVPVECWSHTPGRDNPADISSRRAKASQLQTSDTWFHGPSWLVCDEGEWPASKSLSQPSDECNQELKLNRGGLSTTSLANTQVNLTYLLDPKRVSRFHKLLRITAYVLRFINHIQRKPYSTGSPTTAEIKAAEIIWTKEAQRDMDIKQLERQLGLFKDENQVIRDDIEEAITPAHLIIGRRLLNLPDGVVREENFDGESGKEAVQRRATYVAKKIQHFWQRWKREYLVDIREFHRPKKGNISTSPVQVGDIASLRDESQLQRGLWSMGKVERLVTGRDGNVRGARVLRVKNGKRNIIDRPLQKLYPLEIRCANTEEDKVKPARGDEGKTETFERTTPKRAAAVIANDRIGQYFEDE